MYFKESEDAWAFVKSFKEAHRQYKGVDLIARIENTPIETRKGSVIGKALNKLGKGAIFATYPRRTCRGTPESRGALRLLFCRSRIRAATLQGQSTNNPTNLTTGHQRPPDLPPPLDTSEASNYLEYLSNTIIIFSICPNTYLSIYY